jgi:release factor glutamine methyltransferase
MLAQSLYPRLITWILDFLHRQTRSENIARIEGLPVQICPQVFNPLIGRTTQFFIQHMQILPESRVLEIGTGSGAIAVAAAHVAKAVTATDVNPYAVQCAKTTIRLNGREDQIRVLLGDLFSPVQGETFDIILFNPPYFRCNASSWIAKAWSAGTNYELIDRFLTGAREMLKNPGEIQILLSSAASLTQIITRMKETEFKIHVIASGRLLGFLERIYLLRLV